MSKTYNLIYENSYDKLPHYDNSTSNLEEYFNHLKTKEKIVQGICWWNEGTVIRGVRIFFNNESDMLIFKLKHPNYESVNYE